MKASHHGLELSIRLPRAKERADRCFLNVFFYPFFFFLHNSAVRSSETLLLTFHTPLEFLYEKTKTN